ncbi:hypothetical protein R5R35_013105 [Gryllus longicercus]|uniref:Uncharacterized protein n=1 Tax=Gryllus longicercus TaxID=2509291 RepID=A0AAN9W5R0_9ORTH
MLSRGPSGCPVAALVGAPGTALLAEQLLVAACVEHAGSSQWLPLPYTSFAPAASTRGSELGASLIVGRFGRVCSAPTSLASAPPLPAAALRCLSRPCSAITTSRRRRLLLMANLACAHYVLPAVVPVSYRYSFL